MTSATSAAAVAKASREARIPLWRRLTALFTLTTVVVLAGLALAAITGATILMILFLLERAIS